MTENRTTSRRAWLDSIIIMREGGDPQYQQLYRQIKDFILQDRLPGNTALPSTRALAADLMIARNTVVAAYEQLEVEGFIETRQGASARVVPLRLHSNAERPQRISMEIYSKRGSALLGHQHYTYPPTNMLFQPGMPDMKSFPFNTWRKKISERAMQSAVELYGYHSFGGFLPLREAIATYLQTSRGVKCTPDHIVITNGTQAAIDLIARLFLDEGDTVLLEEPGYTGARSAFLMAGARLAPLRVDADGWRLQEVEKIRPRLIYVTPSCQFPLGSTMRMEQRMQLIDLADRTNAWIVEDDCESEHRFSTKPVAALQGSDDANHTIYIGTFSKSLFPSLRISFVVLPRQADHNIEKTLFLTGKTTPLLLQAALADFIEDGHFIKHLRRMRRLYSERRSLFSDLVNQYLGRWLQPSPGEAGLHTLWIIKDGESDLKIVDDARRYSMGIVPLSPHFMHEAPIQGLLMGYAGADESRMRTGLRKLAGIFQRME